jgi:hypothetical protein
VVVVVVAAMAITMMGALATLLAEVEARVAQHHLVDMFPQAEAREQALEVAQPQVARQLKHIQILFRVVQALHPVDLFS